MVKDLLSEVIYQRNIVVFIHMPVLDRLELNNIILTNNLMTIVQVIPRMKRMMLLVNNYKMGRGKFIF